MNQCPQVYIGMIEMNDLSEIHTAGFDLEDVKFTFTRDFKAAIQGIEMDAKESEMMNIPRYVARILEDEGYGQIHEPDMVVELKQAIVKENVQGEFELSTLDEYFYIRLRSYMKRLSENDYDKVESMLNSLLRKRHGKIIHLADSARLTTDLSAKMTVEERKFYSDLHDLSKGFTKQIMGGKR